MVCSPVTNPDLPRPRSVLPCWRPCKSRIDARRELLEDATHKLEALKAAIANENGLDEDDQREAIRSAAQEYNAALGSLKISVDATVDEDAVVGNVPGTSTEALKALHNGY